jgi:hypothetical protein
MRRDDDTTLDVAREERCAVILALVLAEIEAAAVAAESRWIRDDWRERAIDAAQRVGNDK